MVQLVDGKLVISAFPEADFDNWMKELADPNWIYGGAPEITLLSANRDGFGGVTRV